MSRTITIELQLDAEACQTVFNSLSGQNYILRRLETDQEDDTEESRRPVRHARQVASLPLPAARIPLPTPALARNGSSIVSRFDPATATGLAMAYLEANPGRVVTNADIEKVTRKAGFKAAGSTTIGNVMTRLRTLKAMKAVQRVDVGQWRFVG